jgi:protein associated with RNAse G/E
MYIDNTGTKPIIYIQTKSENITSVSDFKRKIKSNIIDELEENTTAYYSNFDEDILIDDSNLKYKTYNINDVLKSTKLHDDIEEMATALYNSFLTTNDCISIRIPTQSF